MRQALCAVPLVILALLATAACSAGGGSTGGPTPHASPSPQVSVSPSPMGSQSPQPANFISLPAGFHATYISKNVPGARFMAFAPNGHLLVSETANGAIADIAPGSSPDAQPAIFVNGLSLPHGLAFFNQKLYVATWTGVIRYDYPATSSTVLSSNMAMNADHNYRSLAIAADGSFFISSGSDCNICDEGDNRLATILHYGAGDGTGSVYAMGVRNASGLAFDASGQLWAVVNQRDNIGPTQAITDNLPPDELDRVQPGGNYGWPQCYPDANAPDRLPNPEYPGAHCSADTPAALNFQAHSAPIGIVFYNATQFPAAYRGGAFVAFHGSWNRSVPTGDKVVFVTFSGGQPTGYQDFATGWLQSGNYYGRPAGLAIAPDGSLYLSDDKLGAVYRISYGP